MEAARRHLEQLAARPRPAGSLAEREARGYCARHLSALGFAVREETFEYSQAPGRLATPWGGVASMVFLAAAGHLGWRGHAGAALAVLVAGAAAVGAGAWWLARHGVLALPWCRAHGVNLVAERGVPAVWLVAHLDSKSQPVPIAVRAACIVVSILVWVAALVAGILQSASAPLAWVWPWLAGVGMVAGVPIASCVVRARSPGALDDASGVAAVLLAAEALPRDRALGVVLTSAEELGLAGARAWVRHRKPRTAINFDGVDDAGMLRLTHSGRRPERLVAGLLAAARAEGVPARSGPLIPGILLDGVALAEAGWSVVTVSKGTLRTVARIHTPRDDLAALTGAGIAESARVVARALEELC